MKNRLPFLLAFLLVVGCEAVNDPVVIDERIDLVLPQDFAGQALTFAEVRSTTHPFAEVSYGMGEGVLEFEYGDLVRGFIIPYDTPFDAQKAHQEAGSRIIGTSVVRSDANEPTLRAYNTRFFYVQSAPNLMFHIDAYTVYFTLNPNGIPEVERLRRAFDFGNAVFGANDLLGTVPELAADFELTSVTPTPTNPLVGNTQIDILLDFNYRLAEDREGVIRAWVDFIRDGQSLGQVAREVDVFRGQGTTQIRIPIDLTGARENDRLELGAVIFPGAIPSGLSVANQLDQRILFSIR